MTAEREGLVDLLAEHQRTLDGPGSCRCGNWPPATHDVDWPTHLADALADLLAARDRRVRTVLDEYFDFDVDPWDDHDAACPAPEDIWRLHRDLKAALAAVELAQSAAATEENRP